LRTRGLEDIRTRGEDVRMGNKEEETGRRRRRRMNRQAVHWVLVVENIGITRRPCPWPYNHSDKPYSVAWMVPRYTLTRKCLVGPPFNLFQVTCPRIERR